jgi:hypothetical protein
MAVSVRTHGNQWRVSKVDPHKILELSAQVLRTY